MRFDQIIENKEEQLDEVRMGQSDLDKFVNSPEASGIYAGFEAELCFMGKGAGVGGEIELELDDSQDTRPDSIEEICDFFDDGDYNGRREIQSLREKLTEQYDEWRFEKLSENWHEVAEEQVSEYIQNNWDEEAEIRKYLKDELDLDEDQVIMAIAAGEKHDMAPNTWAVINKKTQKQAASFIASDKEIADLKYEKFLGLAGEDAAKNYELVQLRGAEDEDDIDDIAYESYVEAKDGIMELLRERVAEALDDNNNDYDEARQQWEEDVMDDDDYSEDTWLGDVGLRWMSEIPGEYGVTWPYYNYVNEDESDNGYNEYEAEKLGDSLGAELNVKVDTGSGYHSVERQHDTNNGESGNWIIEEDGSITADSGDMPAEIVSPPMPLKDCLSKMTEFFAWAKNEDAYSNDTTGLHVGVSLPDVGGKVDYLKLALFLGDQHVLAQFGRQSEFYARSSFEKIQKDIRTGNWDRVRNAMDLMRAGLIELASHALKQEFSSHGKYSSIHMRGKYIEFRSMGNDYMDHIDDVINNVKRYAFAMYIASRPDLYRDEYAKKLYKLIHGSEEKSVISNYFTQYSAGKLSKEQLLNVLRTMKTEREGNVEYWWAVRTPAGAGIEVQAKNEEQAKIKAAQAWKVESPQEAAKWTVARVTDPTTIQRLNNRPDIDI